MGLFYYCLLLFVTVVCQPDERQLMENLFSTYDSKVRPVRCNSTPVEVMVDYWFVSLLDVQEKDQILSAFGWMQMTWVDEFLQWDHNENNITYIVVNSQDIWYPDLVIRNSAQSIYGEIFDNKKYKVPIYSDGTVYFYTAGQTKTLCKLDLTYFPFDAQACYIHVDSWTYSVTQVRLQTRKGVRIEIYNPNGQWTLHGVSSNQSEEAFNGDVYSELKFIFYLKRKPLYYMTNLIIPCCLMSIIVLFVFLLPASADEKVSLSITVLLSFSVFQLLVAGSMPETSDYIPLITVYITFVEFLSSLSLLSTIIVLMLHHHNCYTPPPKWLQTLALDWMAFIFCRSKYLKCSKRKKEKSVDLYKLQNKSVETLMTDDGTSTNNNNNNNNNIEIPEIVKVEDNTMTHNIPNNNRPSMFNEVCNGHALKPPQQHFNPSNSSTDDDSDSSEVRREKNQFSSVFDLVKISLMKINNEKRREEIKRQWAEVALIFDRFFLFIFLTITMIVAVVLLGVLPQFGPEMVEPEDVS